ncbi:MAG: site-specific integrase [Candidatus Omnitrophota bacterium]
MPAWTKPTKRHFNTRQANKKDAERVRDEFLAQRLAQANNETYTEAYLDKVIEVYLTAKGYLAKRSLTAYKATVLEFKDFAVLKLGKMPKIQEIDKPLCEAFLQSLLDKGLNPHTRNDRRNILTNLFIYAVDNSWLLKNPVEKIKKIPEPDSAYPKPLDEEEVKKILNELKEMKDDKAYQIKCFYEIMALVYYAGLRISEVTHLLKSDLEFSSYRINLRNKTIGKEIYRTKTGRNWNAPIVSELEPILRKWMDKVKDNPSSLLFPNSNGAPIKIDHIYNVIKRVMLKVGFPPDKIARPLHRGRHTFTSITRQKGIEEPLVQQALGHKTNIMTRHYTHLSPEHIRNKFNKLSYGQGRKGEI